MPCTTFLNTSELYVPTSNSEINTLLSMVRKETGEDWQIIERNHTIKSWIPFKTPTCKNYYEVYKFVGGCGPWQIMNFYRDGSSSSICFGIPAEIVMAYLYGILCGVSACQEKTI